VSSPFRFSSAIPTRHRLGMSDLSNRCISGSIRSRLLDSNNKDKSFLISCPYLVPSSRVVSTICVSSSMHIISRPLTQAGLVTTDQLNPINLSTFDNLQSYRRILINSINFDNLQSGKDILILSILLVEHFQFISSCFFIIKSCSLLISLLFKIKSCRLLVSFPVGLNHFPISSLVFSGRISSALPIRYARFKQNRSILSCRVLFSRITSRLPIDSSKINSSTRLMSNPSRSQNTSFPSIVVSYRLNFFFLL